MKQYLDLLSHVLSTGNYRMDRTETGAYSSFGHQMRFNLEEGFPLMTTKKTHFKSVAVELLWFLKGDTNTKYLKDNGVSIWDEWADENGDLGPIYGHQWRNFGGVKKQGIFSKEVKGIDQISNLINSIKNSPNSRRHIVCAWNPSQVDEMALPPCHCMFQFFVSDGRLSCMLTQRSADLFLGVPFNIASYALLTHIIAKQCNLGLGELIWSGGDCHIYANHLTQVRTQLSRLPKALPTLSIKGPIKENIEDYEFEDFVLTGYDPDPTIKAKVAV